MKSQKLFPLNKRLDKAQVNELEGFKETKNGNSLVREINFKELVLKYHEALVEAEKELKEIEKTTRAVVENYKGHKYSEEETE